MANGESQKSSGLKILVWVIVGLGGFAILACGGCVLVGFLLAKKMVATDPAAVVAKGNEIVDIEIPEGYDPIMGMNMIVMKMAMFGDQTSGRMLILTSFTTQTNEAQMRQQMRDSLRQQGQSGEFRELESEEKTYTILGADTAVTISKGQGNGNEMRQISFMFDAKNSSRGLFMMMMPEDEWNDGGEALFEKTVTSMK